MHVICLVHVLVICTVRCCILFLFLSTLLNCQKPRLVSPRFPSTYFKSNLCNGHIDFICYIVSAFSLFYVCAGSYLYSNLQRYPQVPLKCSYVLHETSWLNLVFIHCMIQTKKRFAISCLFRGGCFAIETETAVSACQHCECSQRYRDVKR